MHLQSLNSHILVKTNKNAYEYIHITEIKASTRNRNKVRVLKMKDIMTIIVDFHLRN